MICIIEQSFSPLKSGARPTRQVAWYSRTFRLCGGLIRDEAAAEFRRRSRKGSAIPFDLFVRFIASAFVSVMSWWLDSDKPAPPGEIDAVFRALVLPTPASHLE